MNARMLTLAIGLIWSSPTTLLLGQTPLEVVRRAVRQALNRRSLASHRCAAPYFANCEGGIEVVTEPSLRVLNEGPHAASVEVRCYLVARIASTEADMLVLDIPAGTQLVDTITVRRADTPTVKWVVSAWPGDVSGHCKDAATVQISAPSLRVSLQIVPVALVGPDTVAVYGQM